MCVPGVLMFAMVGDHKEKKKEKKRRGEEEEEGSGIRNRGERGEIEGREGVGGKKEAKRKEKEEEEWGRNEKRGGEVHRVG